jgi:hypothetical protein
MLLLLQLRLVPLSHPLLQQLLLLLLCPLCPVPRLLLLLLPGLQHHTFQCIQPLAPCSSLLQALGCPSQR